MVNSVSEFIMMTSWPSVTTDSILNGFVLYASKVHTIIGKIIAGVVIAELSSFEIWL